MTLDVYINGELVFTHELDPNDVFSFNFSLGNKDEEIIRRGYTEEQYQSFLEAHTLYPGKKRGVDTEFENFRKKYKKTWRTDLPKFVTAIKAQAKDRLDQKFRTGWAPEWPMLSVWINQKRWEMITSAPDTQPVLNRGINFKSL